MDIKGIEDRGYHDNPRVNSVIVSILENLKRERRRYNPGSKIDGSPSFDRVPIGWAFIIGTTHRDEVLEAIMRNRESLGFEYFERQDGGRRIFVRFVDGDRRGESYVVDLDYLFSGI